MKAHFFVVLAAAAMISSNGCTNSGSESANKNANQSPQPVAVKPPEPIKPTAPPDPNYTPCNDYYPVIPGSIAKYTMQYSTGLVADATIVIDKADEGGKPIFVETTQIVDRSGGLNINQTTKRRFACDGHRVQVLGEEVISIIDGKTTRTNMRYRDNSVLVPDPGDLHRTGFNWVYAIYPTYAAEGRQAATPESPTIVKLEVQGETDVSVPAGKFKAVKLQRKVNQNLSWDYLVPGMGLVKREAAEGTRWELREYSGLKAPQP
jgi:hypothetical protein